MEDIHYQKYLKYKNKYLQLKQMGGISEVVVNPALKGKVINIDDNKDFGGYYANLLGHFFGLAKEVKCCIKTVPEINPTNNYQKIYIELLKQNYNKFENNVNNLINKGFGVNLKQSNAFEQIYASSRQNQEKYICSVIDVAVIFFRDYVNMVDDVVNGSVKANVPVYSIKENSYDDIRQRQNYVKSKGAVVEIHGNMQMNKWQNYVFYNCNNCLLYIGEHYFKKFSDEIKEMVSDNIDIVCFNQIKSSQKEMDKLIEKFNDIKKKIKTNNSKYYGFFKSGAIKYGNQTIAKKTPSSVTDRKSVV